MKTVVETFTELGDLLGNLKVTITGDVSRRPYFGMDVRLDSVEVEIGDRLINITNLITEKQRQQYTDELVDTFRDGEDAAATYTYFSRYAA